MKKIKLVILMAILLMSLLITVISAENLFYNDYMDARFFSIDPDKAAALDTHSLILEILNSDDFTNRSAASTVDMISTNLYPELYGGAYYNNGILVVNVVNGKNTRFSAERHLNAELEKYAKHNVRNVQKAQYEIKTVNYSYNFLNETMNKLNESFFDEIKKNEIEGIIGYFVDDRNNCIQIEAIDLDDKTQQSIISLIIKIIGSASFIDFENIPYSEWGTIRNS